MTRRDGQDRLDAHDGLEGRDRVDEPDVSVDERTGATEAATQEGEGLPAQSAATQTEPREATTDAEPREPAPAEVAEAFEDGAAVIDAPAETDETRVAPGDGASGETALSDTAPSDTAPSDAAPSDTAAAPESETAVAAIRGTAEVKAIVEALIFASPEPLTPAAIYKLLATEPREDVDAALAALTADYERPGGLQLVEVAGGYQIVTRPDLHEWVRRLFHERTTQKLSVQALETLAVVAYRQPITAAEITEVRGVNTSGVLNTLLERHLIKIVGRKRVVGRPFMYATTKEFLIRFGLNDLGDLPKVEDMAEALGIEAPPLLVEQTPSEEMLPAEEDPE